MMSDWIRKLRQFMAGRYGFDQLGRFLFGLSIVFWLISAILRWTPFSKAYFVFWLLNTLIYFYAIFRILSRNGICGCGARCCRSLNGKKKSTGKNMPIPITFLRTVLFVTPGCACGA